MGFINSFMGGLVRGQIGFATRETMKGKHRYLRDFAPGKVKEGTQLPFSFSVDWGHPHLFTEFINPLSDTFMVAPMEGMVRAGGLTGEAPLHGTLHLRYHIDATLKYAFEFEAQGRTLRYEGEKRGLRPWNLHRTHTTCYGTLTDLSDNTILSESVVHFDLKTLPRFLMNFRIA